MAEAVLNPEERRRLSDWNRSQRQVKETVRRPAWKEYGPRSYRAPSSRVASVLSRPGWLRPGVDDPELDDDQARALSQPPSMQRVRESWSSIQQGTGQQAEAVSRRSRQYAQLRAERRGRTGAQSGEAVLEAEAAAFIRQGYGRIWDGLQEAIADLNFAWFGVLSLLLYPPQAILFFSRLLSGLFGEIEWRQVTVQRVPPYNWTSGPYQAWRLLVNGLIFLLWVAVLVIIIFIAYTQIRSYCAAFGWLITLFGRGSFCAGVSTTQ